MVDFTCSPDDGAGQIVGLPPLEIRCVPLLPLEGTWDKVVWTFGDGATAEGEAVDHVYDRPGQFTVSVTLENFVDAPPDTDDTDAVAPADTDPYESRFGYVTVCGAPEPEFTYAFKGGLDYELKNRTPAAPHCLSELRWDIFEGRAVQGDPWRSIETWEPEFILPREGIWTVVLTVGGIGGTRSAKLEIDAKYALTDDLDLGPQNLHCSTGGPAGLAVGALPFALPFALLLARRRRR